MFVLILPAESRPAFYCQGIGNVGSAGLINETEKLLVRKMYPNPVKDNFTVEFSVPSKGNLSVKIYDILGNIILKKEIFISNKGINRITFNFAELHSGIYILKAVKGSETVSVRFKKE